MWDVISCKKQNKQRDHVKPALLQWVQGEQSTPSGTGQALYFELNLLGRDRDLCHIRGERMTKYQSRSLPRSCCRDTPAQRAASIEVGMVMLGCCRESDARWQVAGCRIGSKASSLTSKYLHVGWGFAGSTGHGNQPSLCLSKLSQLWGGDCSLWCSIQLQPNVRLLSRLDQWNIGH